MPSFLCTLRMMAADDSSSINHIWLYCLLEDARASLNPLNDGRLNFDIDNPGHAHRTCSPGPRSRGRKLRLLIKVQVSCARTFPPQEVGIYIHFPFSFLFPFCFIELELEGPLSYISTQLPLPSALSFCCFCQFWSDTWMHRSSREFRIRLQWHRNWWFQFTYSAGPHIEESNILHFKADCNSYKNENILRNCIFLSDKRINSAHCFQHLFISIQNSGKT